MFLFPGIYGEMDQDPVHEEVAILSAPSCSTNQDEHFHELLVIDFKAYRYMLMLSDMASCLY